MTKKPTSKKKRRNVAPQNPRFLPSAQMTGDKDNRPKKPKAKKSKKTRAIDFGNAKGVRRIGFGKGRRTSASCRN